MCCSYGQCSFHVPSGPVCSGDQGRCVRWLRRNWHARAITFQLAEVAVTGPMVRATAMRMIAIHAQTERKRQDRSARCAEKHRRRARKQRLRGLIRPVSAACATAGAAQGGKRLSSGRFLPIFMSDGIPLGECLFRVVTHEKFRVLA